MDFATWETTCHWLCASLYPSLTTQLVAGITSGLCYMGNYMSLVMCQHVPFTHCTASCWNNKWTLLHGKLHVIGYVPACTLHSPTQLVAGITSGVCYMGNYMSLVMCQLVPFTHHTASCWNNKWTLLHGKLHVIGYVSCDWLPMVKLCAYAYRLSLFPRLHPPAFNPKAGGGGGGGAWE